MTNLSPNNAILCGVVAVYAVVSKLIFDAIYSSAKVIIDEEFHLPQGSAYCNLNFTTWDPKITTLPGLYLVSAIVLAPLNLCNGYWLRFVNYLAGILNLILFYVWFSIGHKKVPFARKVLSSLNLSLLPPLYFFSNLYYTDVVSLTSVLLMIIFSKAEKHFLASLSGIFSVAVRQTNIIWVAMIFGEYFIKIYYHGCLKRNRKFTKLTENNLKELRITDVKNIFSLRNLPFDAFANICAYVAVLFAFAVFVILNGGIVVGDKTAHAAVVHIPQLFYFSLFAVIFSFPHFATLVKPFTKFVRERYALASFAIVLMFVIVFVNTLVHPYLLADNRHYTFYVWNRFYEKVVLFRYAMVGAYLFGFYCVVTNVYDRNNVAFAIVYVPCATAVLILQKMIEVRYFFVPYVLFKMHVRNVSLKLLGLEIISHCVVTYVTLKIFFEKDIFWEDFAYPQKLIW